MMIKKEEITKVIGILGDNSDISPELIRFVNESLTATLKDKTKNDLLEAPPKEFFDTVKSNDDLFALVKSKFDDKPFSIQDVLNLINGIDKKVQIDEQGAARTVNAMLMFGYFTTGLKPATFTLVNLVSDRIANCEKMIESFEKMDAAYVESIRAVKQIIQYKHKKSFASNLKINKK